MPPGVNIENILDQQQPRNRRLAETLFGKCGLLERAGQGMNLMFERAIMQSKPLPNFTGTAAHEVRLTLHGTVQNQTFVRFLEKVGRERLASFSTHDFLILDLIQRECPVPDALKSRLAHLKAHGIIESVGRGRGTVYLLGRRFHAETGSCASWKRSSWSWEVTSHSWRGRSASGQMEFYLRWLKKHEMRLGEEEPIGLVLHAEKSTERVEVFELATPGIRAIRKPAQRVLRIPARQRPTTAVCARAEAYATLKLVKTSLT